MSKNNNKKYAKLLSVFLSFSALTSQVHGMDWPDLFDPEDNREIVNVGCAVFSSFDASTLKRAASVSKNWNRLALHTRVKHSPDRFFTRSMFEGKLKELLEVEEDPLTPLLFSLREAPFFEDIFLKDKFIKILPKDLLDASERADFLSTPVDQRLNHAYVKVFSLVYTKLNTLSRNNPILEPLRKEYEKVFNGLLGTKKGLFTDAEATLKKALRKIDFPKDKTLSLVSQLEKMAHVEGIFPTEKTFRCYFDEVIQLWEKAQNSPNLLPSFFNSLDKIINKLESEKENSRKYEQPLTSLIQIYKNFKKDLSELTLKERARYLKRSRVKADSFPHWFSHEKKIEEIFSVFSSGDLILKEKLGSSLVKPYPEINPLFYLKYCKFNDLLAYKQNSKFQPGMEWAIYALSQILGGAGIVPSTFLVLNKNVKISDLSESMRNKKREMGQANETYYDQLAKDFEDFYWEPHVYGIQITPAVWGRSLMSCLEENPHFVFDSKSFSHHILLGLMTRPGDYKGNNLLINKFGEIIGIDNDLAFVSQMAKSKGGTYTEFKHLLFCLPQMDAPVHNDVVESFQAITPEVVILEWLEALSQQNRRYEVLLSAQDVSLPLWEKVHLPVKLHANTTPQMLSDLHKLKALFKESLIQEKAITHQELFSGLFPVTATYYKTLVQKHGIYDAWEHIYGGAAHEGNVDSFEKVIPSFEDQGPLLNIGDYRQRTLSPEQAAHEIWKNLNLNPQARIVPLIELAAASFSSCFSDQPSLHKSWLQNETLFRALSEGVSDQGLSFLLSLGLDITVRDAHTHQNALHHAIAKKYPLHSLKLLLNSLAKEEQTNLLSGLDHQGLTLLDEVMEQDAKDYFCHLIALGATNCSAEIALKFYKRHVRSNNALHSAFRELMAINGEVDWMITLEELLPPLVSKKDYKGIALISNTYGDRKLPIEVQNQIFDAQKHFIQISNTGNHPVAYAHQQGPLKDHGLYFKLYPALPGLEEAAGRFTRQLLSFGAPYTDLVKLDSFPCLISQEIPGDTLLEVLKTNPSILSNLDEEDTSGMLIAAMLTNPEDGKPDNYIVNAHPTKQNKYRIVGIDNDQAFVPAIVTEAPDKTLFGKIIPIAQVKTVLYCLDQMKNPVNANIRSRFINLHPDRFLEIWLFCLKRLNSKHCELFTLSEQNSAFQKRKCFIGVPFQQGAVRHLYEKFVQLRDLLTLDPTISHINLLAKLEPRLAKRYQAALLKNISVEERFKQVDRPFYEVKFDNKRGESHTTVTESGDILQSLGIPLQEKIFDSIRLGKENFPVQALQELENIRREKNVETLKSLAARIGDINLLKTLNLEESRVHFLKELDKQKKILKPQEQTAILDYLKNQRDVRELILPNFSAMDEVLFQKLSFEHLRILDLRKCTKITNRSLIHLSKVALGLEELNLGFLNQFKEMGDIGVFTDAPLIFKSLRLLNLSHCINLKKILVTAPNLHYLNIENCALLNDQMLDGVIELSEHLQKLAFEGCPLIGEMEWRSQHPNFPVNRLQNTTDKATVVKILQSDKTALRCGTKSAASLKAVTKALKLKPSVVNLSFTHQDLTDLQIEYFSELQHLQHLDLSNNQLTNAGLNHLRGLTNLQHLDLSKNKLSGSDLSNITQLTSLTNLNLYGNALNNGIVTDLKKLINLNNINLANNYSIDIKPKDNILFVRCDGIDYYGTTAAYRSPLIKIIITDINSLKIYGESTFD